MLHVNAGNLYGGVERILATYVSARSLCPEMVPEFALAFRGRSGDELHALGAQVHYVGPVRASRPLSVWRGRRAFRELLATRRYDAVVCHSAWPQAVYGPEVRRAGFTSVVCVHAVTEGRHWTERWARRSRPQHALCLSHDVANSGASVIYPGVPQTVMYAPMPSPGPVLAPADRDALRGAAGAGPDDTMILQVGRMDPLKGHSAHIQALGALRNTAGWVCAMVGGAQRPEEEEYQAGLQRMAREVGVGDRVRFLGERRDVAQLMQAADIFCQPNAWSEGLSIVWMEAFQAGLPIVSVAVGTAPEFIGDRAGVLVPPDDVGALSAALARLVEDGATRRAMGDEGRKRVHELCDQATQIRKLHGFLAGLARVSPA